MPILIDVHEPDTSQLTGVVDYQRVPLNERGNADYMWYTYDGKVVQVERKQWGELLQSLDAVEDQLRRHLKGQPEAKLLFLVEGVSVACPEGTVTLKPTSRENIWITGTPRSTRVTQLYAWLYQINKYVETYFTASYRETLMALTAFYNGDQKEKHNTFTRVYKKVEFNPDPRVTQIIGLFPGIGEKRAGALVREFGTVYNIITASPAELKKIDGIGDKLAIDILRQAGRLDV